MKRLRHEEYMNGMFANDTSQCASAFNQDLSGWCVLNFTTPQNNFATNSSLLNDYMPDWGESCD
jgi:hypothetical protein